MEHLSIYCKMALTFTLTIVFVGLIIPYCLTQADTGYVIAGVLMIAGMPWIYLSIWHSELKNYFNETEK